jgi:ATP-dependent helicase STH1/SNF2
MNIFQCSILEPDQDEITEDDDMNDDELNELIARHKSEVHGMDIQREKDALESWRARGKRGNPPPPV